jgi:hypothetical protein
MTADQYKEAEDAPIRMQVLKRKLGSWPRIMNMLGEKAEQSAPPSIQTEEPVVEQLPVQEPVVEELPVQEEVPAVEEKPKTAPKTKGA